MLDGKFSGGYNSKIKNLLRQKGKNKEEEIFKKKNATQKTTTSKTTQCTKRGKCFLIDITLIIIIHGNTSYQQFRSSLLAHSLFAALCESAISLARIVIGKSILAARLRPHSFSFVVVIVGRLVYCSRAFSRIFETIHVESCCNHKTTNSKKKTHDFPKEKKHVRAGEIVTSSEGASETKDEL